VLALVAGGVLLALHPSATFRVVPPFDAHPFRATSECFSPFNRVTDYQGPNNKGAVLPYFARPQDAACSSATTSREHVIDALGVGAVLIVGVSFLPRRRTLATKRSLEASPV
jgi:hypothetical protein